MAGAFPVLRIAGILAIGGFSLSFVSAGAMRIVTTLAESKRKKIAPKCLVCSGVKFIPCKLCKSQGYIQWSPLAEPHANVPCQCPTCEGNKIQRCLNCIARGYV